MCHFLLQILLTFLDYPLGLKVRKHGLLFSIRGGKPSKKLLLMKTAISKNTPSFLPALSLRLSRGVEGRLVGGIVLQ